MPHKRKQTAEAENSDLMLTSVDINPKRAIIVLGPSSSGKTTLCNALAQELGIPDARYIREVARTVMKTQGFSRNDTATLEMQLAIMAAQAQAEVSVLALAEPAPGEIVLLSDRSVIDPVIYASTAQGHNAQQTRLLLLSQREVKDAVPLYRRSLVVVLHPVQEWMVDDGVRSLEDPRRYNEILIATLHELGIRFVEMGESVRDISERVNFVRRCLEGRYGQYKGESDAADTQTVENLEMNRCPPVQRASSCRVRTTRY